MSLGVKSSSKSPTNIHSISSPLTPKRSSHEFKATEFEGRDPELRPDEAGLLLLASSKKRKGIFRSSPSLSSLSFLSPCLAGRKFSQISLVRNSSKNKLVQNPGDKWMKNFFEEEGGGDDDDDDDDDGDGGGIATKGACRDSQDESTTEAAAENTPHDNIVKRNSLSSPQSSSLSSKLITSSSSARHSNNNNNNNNNNKGSHTPPCSPSAAHRTGTRYKLITENDVQVCRLNHTKTVVSKIMNSRYLRRWECHHLLLGNSEIWSSTPTGFMEHSLPYSSIQDINTISRWDAGHKFCLRITIGDGSVLLQASNSYLRDQWLHSIRWKGCISKYDKILRNTKRLDVLTKEIKQLIDLSLSTPIQDDSVNQFPLELVSLLIKENAELISHVAYEQIIIALAPLLEKNHPTQQMCEFFTKHCKNSPRSQVTLKLFTPVIHRILKHNVDFGRYLRMQVFIQEYIQALNCQNNGDDVIREFIKSLHGPASLCPHPRVLPNLVAVCLSTVYSYYEDRKNSQSSITSRNEDRSKHLEEEQNKKLLSYISILQTMSEFDDWRTSLATILQPIPFPDNALAHGLFMRSVKPLIQNITEDSRCDVHTMLLGMRDGKPGWFDLYCPGGIASGDDDDAGLYSDMLKRLISCCCKRKKFFYNHIKMIGPWQLMALRENEAAIEALCTVLELEVCESHDNNLQIVTTLQSTNLGKKAYNELCQRQLQLQEIQQKGGPRKLTLPSRSTDDDLRRMLSSGSFGNLECLSLAFTQVTSACALDLIKLPSLRYLNLWSTQFGDTGLQVISEYMPKLQVLNLCETPVTDKGLSSLSSMRNLRRLNLNSTHLSAPTFQELKEKLPSLKECDVRYTDAW